MSNPNLIRDLTTIVGDPDVRLEVLIEKLAPFPFEYDRRKGQSKSCGTGTTTC